MFAITGATGQLGRKIIASLGQRVDAAEIVAVARDVTKAATLGVAVRAGDYKDKDSLIHAFAGVKKLLLVSSSSLDTRRLEHANVFDAARQAGVRHVIYTSCLHAQAWRLPFAEDHLVTEQALKTLGCAYTILRNGWYWENHTVRLPAAVQFGALIGSAGAAQISWASRQDFADAAAIVLSGDGHEGRTYELAGDGAHTCADLAAEAARQSGRPVASVNLAESEFAAKLADFGLPSHAARIVAEIEARGVASGLLNEPSRVLSQLIGRPTQRIAEAVAEALAA